LQEKSEKHRRCYYHLVEASCLVSGAANKQKKNYSGFCQPVADRLGLLELQYMWLENFVAVGKKQLFKYKMKPKGITRHIGTETLTLKKKSFCPTQ